MNKYEQFKKCTNTTFDGDSWDIECKLGLWSVNGVCEHQVQDEALHYFLQYLSDGEYFEFVGGKSPTEVLMEKL